MTDFNYTPPPPRPAPPALPMLILPDAMVKARMINVDDNNMVRWIRTINWDSVQRKRIDEVLMAYRIGHSSKNGMTIFWQIDDEQRVRTGKMMKYYPEGHPKFGHRDKDGGYTFDWIHSALFRDKRHPEYDEDKQEMKQCYFGIHLLNKWKRKGIDQTVCIVESEKTALIMAIAYGNHANQVWLACGGIENLTREKLKPIIDQHRPIILYPDRDGIQNWQQKAEQLHYDRLTVDIKPVTEWWSEDDGPKADIADVVVRMINQAPPPPKTIDEVRAQVPAMGKLIDNMNLTIEPT